MNKCLLILGVLFSVCLFSGLHRTAGGAEGRESEIPEKNAKTDKKKKKDKKNKEKAGDAAQGRKVSLVGGDLETALSILNLFEKQPDWKVDLTRRAYEVFSGGPEVRFADLIADETVRGILDEQKISLLGGPMLGQVSETGAKVWVRTRGPASVSVRIGEGDDARRFGPVSTRAEDDFSASVDLDGLEPGKTYVYRVLLDDKPVPGAGGVLRTVDPEQTRIVFGSCAHRWGLANPVLWDQVISRNPHALFAYGDVAVQDRKFHFGLHRFDYLLRDLHRPWRRVAARVPVYASWDDHDYLDNDVWGLGNQSRDGKTIRSALKGTDADRRGIRRVFQTSWNNPGHGFDNEKGGIFLRTRIGAADVIMTDNRYFRGKEGPYLGEGQMKWLEAQLLDCKGPFIILTCGTLWTDYKGNGKDSWGVFDPEGRERILGHIEKNRIPGVLLLSGDWHGARGYRIRRPSGYTFYEFQPASLGGRGGAKGKAEFEGSILFTTGGYAFGEFTFDARKDDPTVTFRLMMEDGSEHYKITLTRSQLTPGKGGLRD